MKHDIFISYASVEKEEALDVKRVLETNGYVCWMAPESIPGGSSYANEIENAISSSEAVVVVLSDKSQNSIWIPKEIDRALTHRKIIVPFHIDKSDIRDPFTFLLSDSQRIEAFNNISSAYEKLLSALSRVIEKNHNEPNNRKDEKDVSSLVTSHYDECKINITLDEGTISFASHAVESFKDFLYLDYSGEVRESITKQLEEILSYIYQIKKDEIKIEYYPTSEKVRIVLLTNEQWHIYRLEDDYKIRFKVQHFETEKKLLYDAFHFDLDTYLNLSFFKKTHYLHKPGDDIIPFDKLGIDEKSLINTATELIKLCHPNKKIKVQNKFSDLKNQIE